MSKYNFDEIIPRRGSNSYKWDTCDDPDVVPLWVADMDFKTAPEIIRRIQKRVEHGIFGYTKVPKEYYESIVNWFGRKHNWKIQKEWIIYTTGVVPAISAIIKALTTPGDKVLVQTPVYNCFFSSIRNNECLIEENPLIYNENDHSYEIDFDDLELKTKDERVKVLLFCNPHNPCGRVWKYDELKRVSDICLRNGVKIISDEIHNEIVYPGFKYIPFASINNSEEFLKNIITCISPTKSFNIAGLQIANIVAYDEEIRKVVDKAINIFEICDVNPFGVEALMAAYDAGEDWLEELKKYLYENYIALKNMVEKDLPMFKVTRLEGTYLVWLDCRTLGLKSEKIAKILLKEQKIWINPGTNYGDVGEGFIRINIACPRKLLLDSLEKFKYLTSKN